MKKNKKLLLLVLPVLLLMVSCKKEETLGSIDNITGLGGDSWVKNSIDQWIYDSLTVPYNISVKYKWDQGELQADLDRNLVPPKEETVIPVLSSIRRVWINSYVAEGGMPFFRSIAPKFFVLVGSPAYQRGAIKLGTAEGGIKVTLYNTNSFRTKGMAGYTLADTGVVKEMFHVIAHEFAHILDQNVQVPIAFSATSASVYTSDWLNVTPLEAKSDGFVSQYAISGKADDWAEMVSLMQSEGRPWFDNYVNTITYTGTTPNGTLATTAQARLRQKESVVVSYFKQAWNIDYYALQTRMRSSISSLLY